jgi:hypothetical protein
MLNTLIWLLLLNTSPFKHTNLLNTSPFKQYYIIDKKISITRISWHANEKQFCWQQSLESRKQCTFIPVCILVTTDNLKAWVCTHPSMIFIQWTKLTILCFINHLAKKSLSCIVDYIILQIKVKDYSKTCVKVWKDLQFYWITDHAIQRLKLQAFKGPYYYFNWQSGMGCITLKICQKE